jgi:pentatricopeptide repeat protein
MFPPCFLPKNDTCFSIHKPQATQATELQPLFNITNNISFKAKEKKKMRVAQLSLVLLFLLESYSSEAFVPRNLVQERCCWSSSSSGLTLLSGDDTSSIPEEAGHPTPTSTPSPLEYINMILDTEKNPPGSLGKDVIDAAFPVLWSLGKTETAEGAATVEKLLARLEQEVDAGNDMLKLSNKYYTVAVDAWGKSGSPADAERILKKMVEMGKTNKGLSPSRVTYNALMGAFAKQGNAEQVAAILDLMEITPDKYIKPITNDYNALLSAYALRGEARKAETVLKRMADRCSMSFDCAPDIISYNKLLDAWGKSNEQGCGQRAEEILEALERNSQFQLDSRTYSAAIYAVVRSNEPESIVRAKAIWKHAESSGIVPDVYLNSVLLEVYACSTTPGSAEQAEELLNKMEEENVANAVSYNTVLKAWKASNDEQAPSKAEAILLRMEKLRFADTISYSTVIAAYANKGGKASAIRAEEILDRMEKEGAKPNTYTMNAGT